MNGLFFFCRVIDGDSIAHVGFAVVLRDHDQIHGFLMLCTLRRIMLCTQGTFTTMIPASQKVKAPRLAVHIGCCVVPTASLEKEPVVCPSPVE